MTFFYFYGFSEFFHVWKLCVGFSSGKTLPGLMCTKNPAYGRHQLSWPMQIVGPIQIWRGCVIYLIIIIFKASALWADAFYKSKCPSVCVFVCPSVCLFTFEVPFNGLFAPTSQSWMSNIFKDFEFLGKSNGNKWSNIWTFLFGNGLKSPRKKKVFFAVFA